MRHNYQSPSAKWQNFVTMLFFGIKVPSTKCEIMLHAMSLNLPTLFTVSDAHVFVYVLKQKVDTVNTD